MNEQIGTELDPTPHRADLSDAEISRALLAERTASKYAAALRNLIEADAEPRFPEGLR